MTLLDRYVFGSFLRILAWALLAFIAIYLLVDLFDHLDNFLDDKASAASIGKYYLYPLPFVIDMVVPVSMLLASLFTFGLMGKNNEYSALLSAGLSLARISRSILIFGVLISVASMWFHESVVTAANRRQSDVKMYEIEKRSRDPLRSKSNFTHIGQDGRIYAVRRFRARPPSLESVSIQSFDDTTMTRRVDAKRAVWDEDHWTLKDGAVREFSPDGETMEAFASRRMDGPYESPLDFSRRHVEAKDMNYGELAYFIEWVRNSGGNARPYEAALAQKISFPLVNAIFVLLGLALGAARKKATLWAGFGTTVGLSFLYYLTMSFGLELGKSGAIPVWVSAWGGNLGFGGAGILLYLRANR
jgi:lipopolysaccharide export system permease protein